MMLDDDLDDDLDDARDAHHIMKSHESPKWGKDIHFWICSI